MADVCDPATVFLEAQNTWYAGEAALRQFGAPVV